MGSIEKMNVIEEIKKLLSEKDHSSFYILYDFITFLSNNKELIEDSSGVKFDDAKKSVEDVLDIVERTHDRFYEGKIREALDIARSFLWSDFFIELPIDTPLFRARENDSGFLFSKDEMFHIPFDKRYLIGNQRYSLTGMPCLYLGGSPYVCWEELDRPDLNKCNFSIFKNKEVVYVYDLCIPKVFKSLNDIRRTAIILACSLPANSDPKYKFKEQYVLPQCIFQAIIDKHYNAGEWFAEDTIYGIRYYSTHYLTGKTDIYSIDSDNDEELRRVENYVFPSLSSSNTGGLSKPLLRAVDYSAPISILNLSIKDPTFYLTGDSDEYKVSLFGAVDDTLRQRIGVERIRKDVSLLLCQP